MLYLPKKKKKKKKMNREGNINFFQYSPLCFQDTFQQVFY